MAKKKKTQIQEGLEAPQKDTVFPETGAAQGAAAATQVTIPDDVAELIRATLKVAIAQRKIYGLSTTLTSLTKTVARALEKYIDGIPTATLRDFIKREVTAMGYPVIEARVGYTGVPFIAETVILYRNYEEIVDMIRTGRAETLKPVITGDGIDPIYDKMVKTGSNA
jgi:hypothetical protein